MSLATNIANLAVRAATESKALRMLINGNLADLAALTTSDKRNLVAAINEVLAVAEGASGGGAAIDDATPRSTTVYSSSKTESVVAAAVAELVGGAPEALDTLKELADALAADQEVVDGVLTALALRVRVDVPQALAAPQQLQARANIGAVSAVDVGDVDTDFVAAYQAALA